MSLLALQRDFGRWLTHEAAEVPARFGEHARPGLAVYLNNYRAQLLGCLSVSFPVVRTWLGSAAFEAAAAAHIDAVPPHAWTLDDYPADFPSTLERLYPSDPQFADLAKLELRLASAFVGTDAAPLDPATLGDVDWDAAILHWIPTFGLLSVATNAVDAWSAIDAGTDPPPVTRFPQREEIAIWRHHFTPRFRAVTSLEAAVLGQAREGLRFGVICAGLVERLGEEAGTAAAGGMLGQWLADGVIARISA